MNPYGGPPPFIPQGVPPQMMPGFPGGPMPGMPFPPGPGFRGGPPPFIPPTNPNSVTISAAPTTNVTVISAAPVLVNGPLYTIYVGKIPPGVEDDFLRKLLDECGRVKNWRRVSDPVTGKLKQFGFCDYEDPNGVLRALRVLSKFKIDDQELLLKVDEKVSKMLEGYIRENIIKKNGIVKNGPIVLEQDDYLPDSIKTEDNKLKNTITELLFKRDRGDNYFYYDGNTLDKEIKSWRERQNIAPTSNNSNDKKNNNNNGIMEEEERERRNRMEKERENKRKEREEREFRQREKDWEFREFERSKERSKLIEIEKRQQMRAERDLNYDDNDRKKRTREYYRKKREREREREEDLIDIQLEINEQQQEEQYRLLKLQYQQAPIPTVTANTVTNNNNSNNNNNNNNNYYNQQMNNPYKMNSNYNTSPVAGRNMNTTRSPIMTSPTNYYNGNDNIGNTSPLDRSKMGNIAITLGSGNKDKKQTVVIPGFDNEPDNDELYSKKKKKLGALDQHMQEENEKKAKIDKVKNLIETIPTEKDPLFAHPIDWDIIDQHQIVEKKMRSWVTKKIIEYLGEEEKTLIDFILSKITSHTPPHEVLEQIGLVLDDEANTFVLKMWRMLVFEMLTVQHNLAT